MHPVGTNPRPRLCRCQSTKMLSPHGVFLTTAMCNLYKRPLSKRPEIGFYTNFRLMQVKNIGGEHSAIVLTFIKLPIVIKIADLSFFEWPFYAGLTVLLFIE